MKNFYFLAIITVFCLINSVCAEDIEDFYIIHVAGPSGESRLEKRQEGLNFNIESAISQIHNLIVEEAGKFRKRSIEEDKINYARESDYVYQIAELNNRAFLYSYLSVPLLKEVDKLPNIEYIEKDYVFEEEATETKYIASHIKQETGWKSIEARGKAKLYLSSISQGPYNSELAKSYDDTYYAPETAGKDVAVFIIDGGFNFNHPNFANRDERTIRCMVSIKGNKYYKLFEDKCMESSNSRHGTMVATLIGGAINGVAPKASIYGMELDKLSSSRIAAALDYIKRFINVKNSDMNAIQQFFKEFNNNGYVIVASSGDKSKNVKSSSEIHLPSAFDYCIGVMATKSQEVKDINGKIEALDIANYGAEIYAPGDVQVRTRNEKDEAVVSSGTGSSYSAALVSGVVALIMSESSTVYNYKNNA
ncbi:hypothetical protein PIROE2DRAFT_7909 [Piromyces sp. E2]|nr:hypothetical protein PIROE2DRAFT_7909 [Piromyces sp. E2]|eukprot:OUM65182.1 hypothetical protein PIROE2DRAFT_7909 [Piromyces sp. E2]